MLKGSGHHAQTAHKAEGEIRQGDDSEIRLEALTAVTTG